MSKKLLGIIIVIILILAVGGFWVYSKNRKPINDQPASSQTTKSAGNIENSAGKPSDAGQNNAVDDDAGTNSADAEEIDANKDQEVELFKQCEAGQWINVDKLEAGQQPTKLSGKIEVEVNSVDPTNEDSDEISTFYLAEKRVVTSNDQLLGFFESRQVEAEMVGAGDGIKIARIRCTGVETDKNADVFRQKVMNHIKANINSLVPEKGEWQIDDFLWPNSNNVYVEFYDAKNDEDDVVYSLLYEVAVDGDKVTTKELAYMKMGENDDDWKIVKGEDKFKAQENLDYYEYESTLKKWVIFQ